MILFKQCLVRKLLPQLADCYFSCDCDIVILKNAACPYPIGETFETYEGRGFFAAS